MRAIRTACVFYRLEFGANLPASPTQEFSFSCLMLPTRSWFYSCTAWKYHAANKCTKRAHCVLCVCMQLVTWESGTTVLTRPRHHSGSHHARSKVHPNTCNSWFFRGGSRGGSRADAGAGPEAEMRVEPRQIPGPFQAAVLCHAFDPHPPKSSWIGVRGPTFPTSNFWCKYAKSLVNQKTQHTSHLLQPTMKHLKS